MGLDLLSAREGLRKRGMVSGAMNSTFISLIPKIQATSKLGDYRSISLCNFVYKVIAKTIANRLKPKLSKGLSMEQFGFLQKKVNIGSGGAGPRAVS